MFRRLPTGRWADITLAASSPQRDGIQLPVALTAVATRPNAIAMVHGRTAASGAAPVRRSVSMIAVMSTAPGL